jgi:hypothetical protein
MNDNHPIPTTKESAARADELQRQVGLVLKGHPHEQVICVCASLLGQAIANLSDTPDQACAALVQYVPLISQDIRANWHLVLERRRKG